MENNIEVNNLSKKYDSFELNNINFTVPKGSIVGFVGENGAGKTTTIKSILNITNASGDIKILGKNIKQYEKEIESLVKDKLKEMIKQDKLDNQNKVNDDKGLDKEKQENINITNNKDLSINHNIKTSVPTFKKEFEETKQIKI